MKVCLLLLTKLRDEVWWDLIYIIVLYEVSGSIYFPKQQCLFAPACSMGASLYDGNELYRVIQSIGTHFREILELNITSNQNKLSILRKFQVWNFIQHTLLSVKFARVSFSRIFKFTRFNFVH